MLLKSFQWQPVFAALTVILHIWCLILIECNRMCCINQVSTYMYYNSILLVTPSTCENCGLTSPPIIILWDCSSSVEPWNVSKVCSCHHHMWKIMWFGSCLTFLKSIWICIAACRFLSGFGTILHSGPSSRMPHIFPSGMLGQICYQGELGCNQNHLISCYSFLTMQHLNLHGWYLPASCLLTN